MQSMEKFIQNIAREAGDAVLKRFGKDGVHYTKSKSIWDVVTKADLLSEKIIISRIKKEYPDHGIIAEESGNVDENAEYVWITDPIDGTLNFSRGVPMFGVMICLARRGKVILSVVNLPATKELFFAKAGKGAYLNGKRIYCSTKKTLDKSFGYGSSSLYSRNGRLIKNLLDYGKKHEIEFGSFGSAAHTCYLAAGRRDWAITLPGKIWDFAPVYLILKESGCKVTNTKGESWKLGYEGFVAANPRLHKELLKLTKNV